jgi:hypothetical protein
MITREQYKVRIEVLGQELAHIHIYLEAISEIIEQSNVHFNVYKKYHEFFSRVYYSFYDQLIHGISRVHDGGKKSLSIVKLLEKNLESYDDDLTAQEKTILDGIKNNPIGKKIIKIRNALGKAHLDDKVSTDIKIREKFYEENKSTLAEKKSYVALLDQALCLLINRLDQPIMCFVVNTLIRSQIRKMFENLSR